MLPWIGFSVFCLVLIGWLALDWWMGWTARRLDAAIDEFEEEWRRDRQHVIDRALIWFAITASAAYLLVLVLLAAR
jgi:hypothetical protein